MWNFEVTVTGDKRIKGSGDTIGQCIKQVVELVLEHGDDYVGHIMWKQQKER